MKCFRTFIFLIFSLNAFGAAPDYLSTYQLAIKKIEKKQWKQALSLFDQISEYNQQEKISVQLSPAKSLVYLPKYYRSVAEFNLDLCQQAEKSWISSLAQQVVKKFKDKYEHLVKMRAACRSRKVDGKYVNLLAKPNKRIGQLGEEINEIYAQLSRIKNTSSIANDWRSSKYLVKTFGQKEAQYKRALVKITDVFLLESSSANLKYAERLVLDLELQIKQLKELIKQLNVYVSSIENIRNRLNTSDKTLSKISYLKKRKAMLNEQQSDKSFEQDINSIKFLRKELLKESKQFSNLRTARSLDLKLDELPPLLQKLKRLEVKVDSLYKYSTRIIANTEEQIRKEKVRIYRGVDLFFSGKYQKVIDLLAEADFQDKDSLYYKNIFIAAAYFSNPRESESEAKVKAAPYVVTANKLKSSDVLSSQMFSPKFLAFVKETK